MDIDDVVLSSLDPVHSAQSDENILYELPLNEKSLQKKVRVPKRVIHFSDGIVEEYSSDEEDADENTRLNKVPDVDPLNSSYYQPSSFSVCDRKITHKYETLGISACKHGLDRSFPFALAADTCGEKLAWFFGITSPKYQYAIDEYNRRQEEEKEEREREEREQEAERQRNMLTDATRVSSCHVGVEPDDMPNVNTEFSLSSHNKQSAQGAYANEGYRY